MNLITEFKSQYNKFIDSGATELNEFIADMPSRAQKLTRGFLFNAGTAVVALACIALLSKAFATAVVVGAIGFAARHIVVASLPVKEKVAKVGTGVLNKLTDFINSKLKTNINPFAGDIRVGNFTLFMNM